MHYLNPPRPRSPSRPRCVLLRLRYSLLLLAFFLAAFQTRLLSAPLEFTIHLNQVTRTMAGGFGASWHAIGPEVFWYSDLHGRVNRWARGSAFGANPPLNYTNAWKDILRHARWLGMDFIRVEIDMRMYEPQREQFSWDNNDMLTLCRILDYCQSNKVDVFLTQMWQDVSWNAYPRVSRLQSAPRSVEDFAHGLGALCEHLVKEKSYTCIRWLCLANEPGVDVAWWNGPGNKPLSLMPAVHAVRAELDRRGLASVRISGPDCHLDMDPKDFFELNDPAIAAHDAHHYGGVLSYEKYQQLWAERAHAGGVPFFQTEFGTSVGDNPQDNPNSAAPRSYASQLENARKIMLGLKYGIDGFNRWSFLNRGDLDGQWQLLRTWDTNQWEYFPRVVPETVPYYAFGIFSRFTAKYSQLLGCTGGNSNVLCAALRSPRGALTVFVLNVSPKRQKLHLVFQDLSSSCELNKYQVTEAALKNSRYRMEPLGNFTLRSPEPVISEMLPPRSITAYTTYHLTYSDNGVIEDPLHRF